MYLKRDMEGVLKKSVLYITALTILDHFHWRGIILECNFSNTGALKCNGRFIFKVLQNFSKVRHRFFFLSGFLWCLLVTEVFQNVAYKHF